MLVAGAAATAVGVGAATAAAYGTAFGAGAGGAATAASGLLLLGPALAVGGIVRGVRNSAVNKQIEQRQTEFPIEVTANGELALDVFFPLAPSPGMVEIKYTDGNSEHSLTIDTSVPLHGLHIDSPEE